MNTVVKSPTPLPAKTGLAVFHAAAGRAKKLIFPQRA